MIRVTGHVAGRLFSAKQTGGPTGTKGRGLGRISPIGEVSGIFMIVDRGVGKPEVTEFTTGKAGFTGLGRTLAGAIGRACGAIVGIW